MRISLSYVTIMRTNASRLSRKPTLKNSPRDSFVRDPPWRGENAARAHKHDEVKTVAHWKTHRIGAVRGQNHGSDR
ncbi:hypothetical protein HED60_04630 [Planctomycetales bacterium ZRK34]|nr:hypothetical protein HED60_04630 [Planctomycetales bacterium ZRK34]